jgi:hypothetical protein
MFTPVYTRQFEKDVNLAEPGTMFTSFIILKDLGSFNRAMETRGDVERGDVHCEMAFLKTRIGFLYARSA